MAESPWIESNGGPLLLLPEALLSAWSGTAIPPDRHIHARFRWQGSGPASDYDRACDVQDYAAVIPIGGGSGLVLAGEPLPMRWIAAPDGGVLVGWIFGGNEIAAELSLTQIPGGLPWKEVGRLPVPSSPLRLIDSADAGGDLILPNARIELQPGTYTVAWARCDMDPETAFLLVRLSRVQAARPSA